MKLPSLPSRRKLACFCSLSVLVLLTSCSKVLHWSRADQRSYQVDSSAVDSTTLALVQPYSEVLWSEMNEVIGQCAQPLNRERPEGTLNNWVADVMRLESEKFAGTPVDFAISNYGGIRINTLPAGPVTLGRIYEIMPFDNLLVIVEIQGSLVQTFLDHMASEGGWPVSRELRFIIADNKATNITINGVSLDEERSYYVAMSDYVANGGDHRDYLIDLPGQTLNYLVRDALITHVRNLAASGQSIVAEKDGRIKHPGAN